MIARLLAFAILLFPLAALAGEADVLDVKVRKSGAGLFGFTVTLKHADTGWKHYANAWEVRTEDGKLLGKRTLYHPHVNEQPFTRSLSGVKIPAAISHVIVRAHDSVHAFGGKQVRITVPH